MLRSRSEIISAGQLASHRALAALARSPQITKRTHFPFQPTQTESLVYIFKRTRLRPKTTFLTTGASPPATWSLRWEFLPGICQSFLRNRLHLVETCYKIATLAQGNSNSGMSAGNGMTSRGV